MQHQHALLFTKSVLGAGICAALRDIPGWTIWHETWHETTPCPEHMVELAQRYCPAVTLFDMTCLPVLDLFQVFGQASVKCFGRVIVATLSGLDEEELFRMSMWGVTAHISGDTEPGELADILQRVSLGEYLLTEDCLRKARLPAPRPRSAPMIEAPPVRMRNTLPIAAEELLSTLTEREAEVLCCIAQGMTNKQVARALGISENTVKNYVTDIFAKVGVYDRTSAVVCALKQDWIRMPEVPRTRTPRTAVA
jgi:DNA-binding NarL/FixJ family response regulator